MSAEYNENDSILLLKKWLGTRTPNKNMALMKLEEIDQEVGSPIGVSQKIP